MEASEKIKFMQIAMELAQKAFDEMETPIGALIVKNGQIISQAYNKREQEQDVTLHAEMIAIREACKALSSWRLDDCDLFVNLEPCIMCAGAIQQAKIRKVYFGAPQHKSGGLISKAQIFDLDLNHKVEFEAGLLEEESQDLLSRFFVMLREKDMSLGLSKGQRRDINKGL